MSRAEARDVPADSQRARAFLEASKEFYRDAEQAGTSLNGAAILYYQACVSAMKAVLAAAGRDVASGEAGHLVLIGETNRLLGDAYTDLLNRVSEDRRERNDVSYAAANATPLAVDAMRSDAGELIDAAQQFVD